MTLTVFRLLLLTHFLLLIRPLPLKTLTLVRRPAPLQQKKERNHPFLIFLCVRHSLTGKNFTTTFLFPRCSVFLPAENYSLLNTVILYRSSCPVLIPLYFTLSERSKKSCFIACHPLNRSLTISPFNILSLSSTPQTGICRAEHGSPASREISVDLSFQ